MLKEESGPRVRTDKRHNSSSLRLATAVVASLAIAFTSRPDSLHLLLGAGAAGCIVAILRGETSWRTILRRLLAVNAFVLLVWLSLPWSLTAHGPAWSPDGAALAAIISLRTNAIALATLALLAGMDSVALARAAAGLGLPVTFTRLLALTVRYIGLLGATRTRIERAARARGLRPGFSRRTLAVTAQMVALLLVHALLRAEASGLAMRARGWSARARQAVPWRKQVGGLPWVAASGVALLAAWLLPYWPLP